MQEYEFVGHWTNKDTLPTNATRCLVTDGDLVIIATYLTDGTKSTWMFHGLDEKDKFNVIGWMELPRPMKKPEVEITNEKVSNKHLDVD